MAPPARGRTHRVPLADDYDEPDDPAEAGMDLFLMNPKMAA